MTIAEQVKAVPYWYHRIELPGGIVTPGWAPVCADAYRIPKDLTGKRILDIGAWDGYWTFEALKRGAKEVVAIDDFSDMPEPVSERTAWDTFDLCRAVFGYDESRCKRIEMSVYDVGELGQFDLVFFFGTIYHLRHPLLALENINAICKGDIYVESMICDDFSPYLHNGDISGVGHGYPDAMVMEFYPGDQLGRNPTNWWSPTVKCLAYMVQCAGWKYVKGWKLMPEPKEAAHCRGFVHGMREEPKND